MINYHASVSFSQFAFETFLNLFGPFWPVAMLEPMLFKTNLGLQYGEQPQFNLLSPFFLENRFKEIR